MWRELNKNCNKIKTAPIKSGSIYHIQNVPSEKPLYKFQVNHMIYQRLETADPAINPVPVF
jgi:hypothetical protein